MLLNTTKMQCRVCMQNNCQVLLDMGIACTDDGKNLYDCFNECTQLEAFADDGLPKTLCKVCAQKLQIAFNFRKCARQSHEDFTKLLASLKVKTESIYSLTEEFYTYEREEENTDDPLDMDFEEAVRALQGPEPGIPVKKELYDKVSEKPEDVKWYNEISTEVQLPKNSLGNCELNTKLKEALGESENLKQHIEKSTGVFKESQDAKQQDQGSTEVLKKSQDGQENDKSVETDTAVDEVEYLIELKRDSLYNNNTQNIMANESDTDDSESESITLLTEKVRYTCEICSCSYATKKELKKHISKRHKSDVICINCSKVFEMPKDLRIHKKLVHETDSPVQCDFCTEKPFMPRTDLLKHFQSTHSCRYFKYFPRLRKKRTNWLGDPIPNECKYCGRRFKTEFDLEDHVKSHVFKCPLCSRNFDRIRAYYTHIKRLHNSPANNVPPNPLVIEGTEMDEKTFECKDCNKSYTRLGSYNTHMKLKHQVTDSNTICDIPDKQFDDIQQIESSDNPINMEGNDFDEFEMEDAVIELIPMESDDREHIKSSRRKAHENSDGQNKKRNSYLCSFCPRVVSTKAALETHERKHLNTEPNMKECPFCQKSIKEEYIKKHIDLVHIAERKFHCDICGGSFKTKDGLYRHRQLHSKERDFPCTICDKSFPKNSELKIHMRSHTGESPFVCHLCDKRFRIKAHLTYHLQKHSNIKFVCTVCGKEFKNHKTLQDHSYKHTGGMPYSCLICDYGSARRENFTSHMLRKHDKVMTEAELFAMFKANTGRSPRVKLTEELEMINAIFQPRDPDFSAES